MNIDPRLLRSSSAPPATAARRRAEELGARAAATPIPCATTSPCCWSTRPASPTEGAGTWFDEARLDDAGVLETVDLRLRTLAESGARVRREAHEAAAATAELIARAATGPSARGDRRRARLAPAARRARAVVPGAVRGLAQPRAPGLGGLASTSS